MLSTRKIAKIANVGVGTVSRYRNGFPVKQSTKEKIDRAIEISEGYLVRQLNIGVIVPVVNDSFSGVLVAEIEKQLSITKHQIIIIVSRDLKKDYNHILSLKLDGLIIHPPNKDSLAGISALSKKIPTVLIDMMVTPPICDQMLSLNVRSTYDCVEYLMKLGHKNIAITTTGNLMLMGNERLDGYKRAVSDYGLGLDESYIIDGSNEESIAKALIKLMKRKDKPTVLMATNYDITIASLRALMNLNLKYPTDISFVGFDEFGLNRFLHKPITFVEQPIGELAKHSTELLCKRIVGNADGHPTTSHFKTKIVEGESVAKLK